MSLFWLLLGVVSCLPWIIGMEYLRRENLREIDYWYENSSTWMRAYFDLREHPLGGPVHDDLDYSDLFDYEQDES